MICSSKSPTTATMKVTTLLVFSFTLPILAEGQFFAQSTSCVGAESDGVGVCPVQTSELASYRSENSRQISAPFLSFFGPPMSHHMKQDMRLDVDSASVSSDPGSPLATFVDTTSSNTTPSTSLANTVEASSLSQTPSSSMSPNSPFPTSLIETQQSSQAPWSPGTSRARKTNCSASSSVTTSDTSEPPTTQTAMSTSAATIEVTSVTPASAQVPIITFEVPYTIDPDRNRTSYMNNMTVSTGLNDLAFLLSTYSSGGQYHTSNLGIIVNNPTTILPVVPPKAIASPTSGLSSTDMSDASQTLMTLMVVSSTVTQTGQSTTVVPRIAAPTSTNEFASSSGSHVKRGNGHTDTSKSVGPTSLPETPLAPAHVLNSILTPLVDSRHQHSTVHVRPSTVISNEFLAAGFHKDESSGALASDSHEGKKEKRKPKGGPKPKAPQGCNPFLQNCTSSAASPGQTSGPPYHLALVIALVFLVMGLPTVQARRLVSHHKSTLKSSLGPRSLEATGEPSLIPSPGNADEGYVDQGSDSSPTSISASTSLTSPQLSSTPLSVMDITAHDAHCDSGASFPYHCGAPPRRSFPWKLVTACGILALLVFIPGVTAVPAGAGPVSSLGKSGPAS